MHSSFRIGAPFGYTRPYELIEGISPRPVMLMHGTSDDLVPIDHSTRLYTCATEPKYLWLAKVRARLDRVFFQMVPDVVFMVLCRTRGTARSMTSTRRSMLGASMNS